MMDATKYAPGYYPVPAGYDSWVKKDHIEKAPAWCSVDLRDGNQALINPMNLQQKLEMFHTLVDIGVKEIEIGFPSASDTEDEICRELIEGGHIPDDVTIQVLVQARPHLIQKTFEAIQGAKNVILHFYNSTSTLQRKVVFKMDQAGITKIATDAADLIYELSQPVIASGMNLRYEYSPESFMGTEMDYAVEICQAVLEHLHATPENKVILNLPSTVENMLPNYFADCIEYFIRKLPSRDCAVISLHPHNDRGEGVATAELGLLAGALVGKMGMKPSVLLLTIGYAVGYGLMSLTGLPILLALAFFIVGIAKGSVLNTCTILVSGNSADRTRGMNTMHACYACGALLCPFLISAAARVSTTLAVLALAALGLVLWLVYLFTPMAGRAKAKETVTDWSFLRSSRFWLLTGLLFCQNAAEQSVVGWMVTYFKDSGIIAGTLAAYTVTVMWGATLIGRLLIAFVFPLKQPRKAMVFMAVFCTAFYFAMMQTHSQLPAILLLFAFAFSMAGMNPTAVASAGKMTTVTSMGIMLPVASSGAILMPWVIGKVAESAGLAVGMATNIVPCVGLIVFAILVSRMREE